MKLYNYNPNNYGERFFVVAENKTKAHIYLINHLKEKVARNCIYNKLYKQDLKMWKKVNPLDKDTFPSGYTLDEIEPGVIIESEIS